MLPGLCALGSKTDHPGDRDEAERRLRAAEDSELDAALAAAMTANPTMRWFCTHGMWATGTGTPREFVAAYLDYHLRDGIAEKIACPTLVCAGTGDQFLAGQPEQLYEHQTSPKTLLEFSRRENSP